MRISLVSVCSVAKVTDDAAVQYIFMHSATLSANVDDGGENGAQFPNWPRHFLLPTHQRFARRRKTLQKGTNWSSARITPEFTKGLKNYAVQSQFLHPVTQDCHMRRSFECLANVILKQNLSSVFC